MKNGKVPTKKQKQVIQSHGFEPDNYLVVKSLPDSLEVVKVIDLKKYRDIHSKQKIRTKKLEIYKTIRGEIQIPQSTGSD